MGRFGEGRSLGLKCTLQVVQLEHRLQTTEESTHMFLYPVNLMNEHVTLK